MTDEILYDKIYACWLGKNIGGTLGGPVEGRKDRMNLTYYPKIDENGALENDDLDLQLVNLHVVEQYGIGLGPAEMGRMWAAHVYFPYDEYGYGVTALRLGFIPPFSGQYDNPFTNCMGSPIRSELWAAVAAGDPALAAHFAMSDAAVDHAGGEGMYGEIFYAALESMAYVTEVAAPEDRVSLIESALEYLPDASRVKAALKDTVKWYREGVCYDDIRGMILSAHGRPNFTDAPQNLAFTMCGWLYGEDFGDGILKAVNMGYDTDCTGATLGALYGILYGRSYIPEKWSRPIGDKIRLSPAVRGFGAPKDLGELTERTIKIRKKLMLEDVKPSPDSGDYGVQQHVFPLGQKAESGFVARLRYKNGSPSVSDGETAVISVEFVNNTRGRWVFTASVRCPEGFISESGGDPAVLGIGESAVMEFAVKAESVRSYVNRFTVAIERYNDGSPWIVYDIPFTMLKKSEWLLDGEKARICGTTVRFADNGGYLHTAKTRIYNPRKREIKLMCASVVPVSCTVDGENRINARDNADYMPAYHRCQTNRTAIFELDEGWHDVNIVLMAVKPGDAFFTFAALATSRTEEPGAFYRHIDITVG